MLSEAQRIAELEGQLRQAQQQAETLGKANKTLWRLSAEYQHTIERLEAENEALRQRVAELEAKSEISS